MTMAEYNYLTRGKTRWRLVRSRRESDSIARQRSLKDRGEAHTEGGARGSAARTAAPPADKRDCFCAIELATRILVANKSAQYFSYVANKGDFSFWLRRDIYRRQRPHDGLFVLAATISV